MFSVCWHGLGCRDHRNLNDDNKQFLVRFSYALKNMRTFIPGQLGGGCKQKSNKSTFNPLEMKQRNFVSNSAHQIGKLLFLSSECMLFGVVHKWRTQKIGVFDSSKIFEK